MQTQNTITVTLMFPQTMTFPRTLTENTDPQLIDDALEAFHRLAENAPGALFYSKSDLATIATAMVEGSAICIRYEHDEEVSARVLYPSAIFLTKENHICVRGFCTMRCDTKSFRVDRMACVHSVVFPGDAVATETAPVMKTEADYWKSLEATGQDYIVIGGRSYARNN